MRTPAPAKISGPSSSGLFLRHRLFGLLDPSPHGPPLVWITGPPGTGKTTLAVSWLDAARIPYLWYDVDEGDCDPASFFYYLGLAAKRAAPRKRKPLPLLTPEYVRGIPAFSRRFFEELYARMLSASGSSTCAVIVFDNCHEVPDGSPFHAILHEGMSRAPRGMKIVLISRKDPPEGFARLRANSLMKVIGWDELKFSLEESKEMLGLRGHGEVPPCMLERLHAKTDGWAAGIVLMLESARSSGLESVLSMPCAPKEIFQYFAGEIFNEAGAETRNFLLKTSLFPRMSSNMAQALTGNHRARRILSELSARNYFTQKLESEADFYQYHPLFREFLQFMAAETLGPEALRLMQKKAGLLLEENGQPEEAVELLRKAQDWPDSVRLILKHAPSLSAQGRGQTLSGWITGLPETLIHSEPWLLYRLGVCRLFTFPDQSRAFFEASFELFRGERDAAGVFLSLSGLFDSIFYALSGYRCFDTTIALLEEILQEFPSFPSPEIEARLTGSALCAMFLAQPYHPDFQRLSERTLSLLPVVRDMELKMHMLQPLVWRHLFTGELSKVEPLLDLLFELVQTPDLYPLVQLLIKDMESFYCWLKADFAESKRAAEQGLELASKTGVHMVDPYLFGHAAAAALNSGEMQAAEAFTDKIAACGNLPVWAASFHYLLRAWTLFLKGDISNALTQVELSLNRTVEAGVPLTESYGHFGAALILHELKKEREAMDHLARCHEIARRTAAPIIEFMGLLAEAHFAFDRGDDPAGLVALNKALSLGRDKGYGSIFFWAPEMIGELCKRALDEGIEVDYVMHLIRKRNLMPTPAPVDCERWPWVFKIYTLGPFEIIKDGQVLQFSRKAQKRPLQLLKVLVSNGGSEVSEDYISDCLWPDSDGDAARSAFKTTLSRLRRLIGIERAITVLEGKVTLDPCYCWVDALAFDRIFARLDKGIEEETGDFQARSSNAVRLAEKALGLYRGHFLAADEAESWSISYREQLRAKFSRLISRTGDLLERAGLWEKAADYYQRGLDIDDASEEFYQRLMICQRELGLYANAVDVYGRCRKLLAAKRGMQPSPKTEAIYRNLTDVTDDSF